MTKTLTNLWLDLLALLLMMGLMLTGGIIHFVLPPGTGRSLQLFGLGRHDYGAVHAWLAAAILAVLALHVILHWSFVCCLVAKGLGKERPAGRSLLVWGAGVLFVTVLLPILGIVWATSQVEASDVPRLGSGRAAVSPIVPASVLPQAAVESDPAASVAVHEEVLAEPRADQRGNADKHEETCIKGAAINGRSTLSEAAAAAGMPVEALIGELKLGGSPAADTRLGRLRRQSGTSIHAVRQIVCR
jgi:hypothetical protein